jgi:hypothetical protein
MKHVKTTLTKKTKNKYLLEVTVEAYDKEFTFDVVLDNKQFKPIKN